MSIVTPHACARGKVITVARVPVPIPQALQNQVPVLLPAHVANYLASSAQAPRSFQFCIKKLRVAWDEPSKY